MTWSNKEMEKKYVTVSFIMYRFT